jgi:phenylacetate-CoA ligase
MLTTQKTRRLIYLAATGFRGQPIIPLLRGLQESQYWSPTELKAFQGALLEKLIAHATANVPYYKALVTGRPELGRPQPIWETFESFPFLTKEIIRSQDALMYSKRGVGRTVGKTTGGTTGPPVRVLKDLHAMGHELAAAWRGFAWANIGVADRQARFWSMPSSWQGRLDARVTDWICNRKRFSPTGYTQATFSRSFEVMRNDRPVYIYGYTSVLSEFANYLLTESLRPDWPMKAVITTAESLSCMDRALIERAFGCRVYDEYGSGEIGTVAHECSEGRLHVNAENMILELIDGGGSIIEKGVGEIAITDLRNMAMPLIRYLTGDLAEMDLEHCGCGVRLPTIKRVIGRAYDALVLPDGRRFHGSIASRLFSQLDKEGFRVDGYQLIQECDYSVLVRLVYAKVNRGVIEERIQKYMEKHLGNEIATRFEYVDSIAREPSGKIRRVKCNVESTGRPQAYLDL